MRRIYLKSSHLKFHQYVCVKSFRKKNKEYKTVLITSFTLLLTTSCTTSDNEQQKKRKRVTTNDNEFQRMTTSDKEWSFWLIFLFGIREEPTTGKWQFPLWHIQGLFQDSFISGKASSSHFNYFDTRVTLPEHLFLQSGCFF